MMLKSHEGDQVLLVELEHAADADTDSYFAPNDVLDRAETVFESLDDAIAQMEADGVDTDAFVEPWKTDFPL